MHPLWGFIGGAALFSRLLKDKVPSAFISFAAEDSLFRSYLVGQTKREHSRLKSRDNSLHEPFSNAWKSQTLRIIQRSDVLILMIGRRTHQAQGAIWEVEKATSYGIPVFGIHIRAKKGKLPYCIKQHPVIPWKHELISSEINRAIKNKATSDNAK